VHSPLSPSGSPMARSRNIPSRAKAGVAIRDGFEGWPVLLPRETKTPWVRIRTAHFYNASFHPLLRSRSRLQLSRANACALFVIIFPYSPGSSLSSALSIFHSRN